MCVSTSTLAVVCCLLGGAAMAQPQGQLIDRVIANVAGRVVLYSDLAGRVVQEQQAGAARLSDADVCAILEDLLFENLLLEQARLDSVVPDAAQVDAELDRRIRYFSQQIGGDEALEKFYGKRIERIKADFREQVSDQLLAQQMRQKITGDRKATPKEVEAFFQAIPKDSLPFINAGVEYARLVKYATPSEEEDRRVKKNLEELRTRITTGKLDFATAATLYSKDEGSARDGGKLPMVKPGVMVPEFDAVALSLKDGEVSQVFKTDFGYHIMNMMDRKGEQYQARHILMKLDLGASDLEKARHFMDSAATMIREGKMTLAQAAVDMNDDEETKGTNGTVIEPDANSPRWAIGDLEQQTFVVLDKLAEGDISAPQSFETPDGKRGYRIFKLNRRTEPHVMDLVEDYPLVSQAAERAAQEKVVDAWVRERLQNIYIRLIPDFANCTFKFPWMAKSTAEH